MEEYMHKLGQVFDYVKTYTTGKVVDLDVTSLDGYLADLMAPGPTFHFVFDLGRFNYEYVSDTMTQILDCPVEEFTIQKRLEYTHPEDQGYFVHCLETISKFLFETLDPKDVPQYKTSFMYRLKVKSTYKLFLHQFMPITFDLDGRLNKTLESLSDISHISRFNPRKISMIGQNGRPSYYNVGSIKDIEGYVSPETRYSDREIQVLRLMAEGFNNDKIGELLKISKDTVRTHRKHILAKSNAANSIQAVAEAIRIGLI